MATTFFLVRHAAHDRVDHLLAGRMAGVSLGEKGRRQAELLAARLEREGIAAIYTSPLERTKETAEAVGRRLGLRPQVAPGLNEIDYGDWTGRSFDSLRGDPAWRIWNDRRSESAPPGGEGMAAVQRRAMAEVGRLAQSRPDDRILLVSHGDVIKSVLAACLGLSLDAHDRFEISPASVSVVVTWPAGAKVFSMNEAIGV